MADSNVVPFTGATTLDLPVDRVLDGARDAKLKGALVLGYTQDGEEYFAGTYADGPTVIWLLERLKAKVLAD
jgi:hypothetical protein